MISRSFDLMGAVLRVEAHDPALVEGFAVLLRGLELDGEPEPAFTLTIETGEPELAASDAHLVYEGVIGWEGNCLYSTVGSDLHIVFPGRISLIVDIGAGTARMVVAAESVSWIGGTTGMLVIDAFVDASGQFLLHAAGLTLPGRDEQIIVFAPSGTGKTTTALALAASGFGLCTDDAMVLRLDDGAVSGWGLPRDLKVHRKTMSMMPWLEPYLRGEWDVEGEQPLQRSALTQKVRVEEGRRRPVAGLFLLERGSGAGSSVVPLGRTDALTLLALDNVKAGRTGLLDLHRRRFANLARLASSVATYKVEAGSDPMNFASSILDAVSFRQER